MEEQEEPCDAQVNATNTNANPGMGMYWGPMQSGTYNVQFGPCGTTVNPTLCNPAGPALIPGATNMYVGDVPWQNVPPPAPWTQPVVIQPVYQPSFTFPTEADLRAFVKKCVHEALDELAREFNENKALQPTSRVE